MEFNETYRRQVALLIRTMPSIVAEECFAMKGGTAINLFVRDLPAAFRRYRPDLPADTAARPIPRRNRSGSLADRQPDRQGAAGSPRPSAGSSECRESR